MYTNLPVEPLISCILVTRNRRPFFAQAVQYYQAQTYPNSELIVVDDGDDAVGDLCRGIETLTYIRLNQRTPPGSILNLGIEASRGEILQKIDDDDYYGPEFLATAASHLLRIEGPSPLVAWCCFAVFVAGKPEPFFSGHGWQAGGTLCFPRSLWRQTPFRDIFDSYDSLFIKDTHPTLMRACAADQYMLVRHGGNTWTRLRGYKSVEGYFRRRGRFPKTLDQLVGPRHAFFYRNLKPLAKAAHG